MWAEAKIERREQLPKFGKIVVDSRKVGPGDIFVATKSEGSLFYRGGNDENQSTKYAFDSHPYIAAAVKNGASAVVFSDPSFIPENIPQSVSFFKTEDTIEWLGSLIRKEIEFGKKKVIGVTGSTGKSTLAEMVSVALGKGKTYKHLSDRPTPISIPIRALNSDQFFKAENVVIEMPMDEQGQISQLTHITPPDVSVILNINDSHLGQLGSIDKIVRAKMEIISGTKVGGIVVLNADDARLKKEIRLIRGLRNVLTFGRGLGSDVKVLSSKWDDKGYAFNFEYNGNMATVQSSYLGESIGLSLVAAVTIAIATGLSFEVACQRLSLMEALPGRMSLLRGKKGEFIFDDTRLATPQSTHDILKTVCEIKDRRKILIQGPILRSYQHGTIKAKTLELMRNFDKVVLAYSDKWLSHLQHGFILLDTQSALLEWYEKNVKLGDLVVINSSEGVKMWEVVRELVDPTMSYKVYNPQIHD